MSICYIVGAMPDPDVVIQKGFVIAADKGVETLQKKGVLPDLIVGDFDSLGYVPAGENTERHPSEKDDTDMLLALRRGMEKAVTLLFSMAVWAEGSTIPLPICKHFFMRQKEGNVHIL
ncbi:MAG: hypothetical protein II359_06670 [Clostridia bacterium]|nr:hypothetical protein [Clostridia bacterium]